MLESLNIRRQGCTRQMNVLSNVLNSNIRPEEFLASPWLGLPTKVSCEMVQRNVPCTICSGLRSLVV